MRVEVDLEPFEPERVAPWVTDYTIAAVTKPPRSVDPASPSSVPHFRRSVEEVVAVESPVHIDIVHERIREAWGIGRITHRVRPNIDEAISTSKKIHRDGDFLYIGSLDNSIPTRRHTADSNGTFDTFIPGRSKKRCTGLCVTPEGFPLKNNSSPCARATWGSTGWART